LTVTTVLDVPVDSVISPELHGGGSPDHCVWHTEPALLHARAGFRIQ
jgi:hypothetical protein